MQDKDEFDCDYVKVRWEELKKGHRPTSLVLARNKIMENRNTWFRMIAKGHWLELPRNFTRGDFLFRLHWSSLENLFYLWFWATGSSYLQSERKSMALRAAFHMLQRKNGLTNTCFSASPSASFTASTRLNFRHDQYTKRHSLRALQKGNAEYKKLK